jgi:heat shock protein HtpX
VTKRTAPQLLNVVRESRIAAGTAMPQVYLIDDTAPNAFATGRDPQHASSRSPRASSRSSTARSSRASSAHELSHVRNYDIRFR